MSQNVMQLDLKKDRNLKKRKILTFSKVIPIRDCACAILSLKLRALDRKPVTPVP